MTTFKFVLNDHVKHTKGMQYCIVGLPTDYRIEETNEPAYAYRAWDPNAKTLIGPIWIRSVTKMEDGRFTKVSNHYADLYGPSYDWIG